MTPDEKRIVEWLRENAEAQLRGAVNNAKFHNYEIAGKAAAFAARDTAHADAIERGEHRKCRR